MALFYAEQFLDHLQYPGHPETPERLRAIRVALEREGLWKDLRKFSPATPAALERVHLRSYLESLEALGETFLTGDTALHRETYAIAQLSAGAGLAAAQAAWEEKSPAVALTRPPGHHAGPDYGMGFCYLNNIAVAAAALRERARRLAIVDLDVHHGNGTNDIFHADPSVLYISTHQRWIYPGTGPASDVGEGEGKGFTVNIPLRSRSGDATFSAAFERLIEPILRAFHPEAILVSLGGDAHYRDPLASLTLSSPGYVSAALQVYTLARERYAGRIAYFLEGGYNPQALGELYAGLLAGFEGRTLTYAFDEVLDPLPGHGLADVAEAVGVQKEFWPLR